MPAGSVSVDVKGNYLPFEAGWRATATRLFSNFVVPVGANTDEFIAKITGASSLANQRLGSINTRSAQREMRQLGDVAEQQMRRMRASQMALVGGVASVYGGVRVLQGLRTSVDAVARLNDTVGFSRQVFGLAGREIEEFASGAADALGQSKQQALESSTMFAVLGKQAGLSGRELVKYSTDLVRLASDMKAAAGGTTDEAITALMSGISGTSTEPLRRYGILLDDLSIKQEAVNLKLRETTTGVLPPHIRVIAAQSLVMKRAGDIVGQYAREYDEFPARVERLRANMANLAVDIGEGALPAFEALAGVGESVLSVFNAMPQSLRAGVGSAGVALGGLAIGGGALSSLAGGIGVIRSGIQWLRGLGTQSTQTAAQQAAMVASTDAATAAIVRQGAAAAATSTQLEKMTADYLAGSVAGSKPFKPEFARAQQAAAAADADALTSAYVRNAMAADQATTAATGMGTASRGAAASLTGALGPALGIVTAGLTGMFIADQVFTAMRDQIDMTKFSVDELNKSLAEGSFERQAAEIRDLLQNSLTEGFGDWGADQLAKHTLGILGKSDVEQAKERAEQIREAIEGALAGLPKVMRAKFGDAMVRELVASSNLTEAEARRLVDGINAEVDKAELGEKMRSDAEMAEQGLDSLGKKAEETMGIFERMATAGRNSVSPLLDALSATMAVEDAKIEVADRQQALEDILNYNTQGIRSAREQLADARAALAEAKKDVGPWSEAADRARKEAQSAEDRLLEIRREMAKELYDKQQRDAKIARGEVDDLGPAVFAQDWTERLAVAQRDVARARGEVARISAGQSDQVAAATERVAEAERRLAEERAKAGPASRDAADAQRDLHRAQLDALKAAADEKVELARLRDELEKHPNLLQTAGDALDEWAARVGLGADVVARLRGEMELLAGAANTIPEPPTINPWFGGLGPNRPGVPKRTGTPPATPAAQSNRGSSDPALRKDQAVIDATARGDRDLAQRISRMTLEEFEKFERFIGGLTPRAMGGPIEMDRDYLVGEKQPEVLRLTRSGAEIIPSVPQALATRATSPSPTPAAAGSTGGPGLEVIAGKLDSIARLLGEARLDLTINTLDPRQAADEVVRAQRERGWEIMAGMP